MCTYEVLYNIVSHDNPTNKSKETIMNIKKQYEELYAILEANQNKKVSTILPQLIEIMTAKQAQRNFITDEDGNVTHVFCYYHKKWEDISQAPYGSKANSASGLASMCKEGVSQWNKQQKAIKNLKAEVLELVTSGELEASEINKWLETRETELRAIVDRADGHFVEL